MPETCGVPGRHDVCAWAWGTPFLAGKSAIAKPLSSQTRWESRDRERKQHQGTDYGGWSDRSLEKGTLEGTTACVSMTNLHRSGMYNLMPEC